MTDSTQHALEQGSYDLIKRRLNNFGVTLKTQTDKVNASRINEFGSTELQVKGRVRARTEQNCTPRDIVIVGDKVIFAYNVFLGLKKETSIMMYLVCTNWFSKRTTLRLNPTQKKPYF